MSDVVVTIPKDFWNEWIAEGDLPGEPWSGRVYDYYQGSSGPEHHVRLPNIKPGERVYVVAHNALRGYAPLVRIDKPHGCMFSLVRHGGAVPVTICETIRGFRGWRYRWWDRNAEIPFPDWRKPSASWATLPGEHPEDDLSSCPYYRGVGTCESGCTTEPSCMTDEPSEGWPSRRAALASNTD
jgi:hypothetical protein